MTECDSESKNLGLDSPREGLLGKSVTLGHSVTQEGETPPTNTPRGRVIKPRKRGKPATVRRLSVEDAGAEMRRPNSGPRINLPLYLRGETSLEILTGSVLRARGIGPDRSGSFLAAVEEAASDPANHPLDCECEVCL